MDLVLFVSFLAVLNPFALFIYLQPLMKDLTKKNFAYVLFKASITSFLIFALFALTGNFIFANILHIKFEAFRIFGGIILFSIGFLFIVKGQRAVIQMKENLDDLASEIALPFMAGAATISFAILIGDAHQPVEALTGIFLIMLINYVVLVFFDFIRDNITLKKFRVAFDKNMIILMRLNSFFIGAIGVNMVITGINNLYF